MLERLFGLLAPDRALDTVIDLTEMFVRERADRSFGDDGVFRGWVPEPYFDEACPWPRATPDAWLAPRVKPLLAPIPKTDLDACVAGGPTRPLLEDERMRFFGLIEFDRAVMELDAEGGSRPARSRPTPPI